MGQVLIEREGVFHGTRSRVAIPFNFYQLSPSRGAISPESLRHIFQWSDKEEEGSDYASCGIISSVQTGFVSINMADTNKDDLHCRMEAQEQTSRTLYNIQRIVGPKAHRSSFDDD